MLHDGIAWNHASAAADVERRVSDRVPCPAEVMIAWLHDPESRIRYRLADVSDGGLRIRTRSPLVEGMTGLVLKLLPTGERIGKPALVAWVSAPNESGEREAGLRFFG